jgi:arylsulfatase A-like enzyme
LTRRSHLVQTPASVPAFLLVRGGALATVFVLVLAGPGCRPAPGPPERIVLVVADTLRRDFLSPYGSKLATPHADELASSGVVFANAVASFHQTTMSMSALFTGRTPSLETGDPATALPWTSRSWCGLARFAESADDTCIPARIETLAQDLRAAGYETIGVVSNRLLFRPYGYERGFDTWIEVGERERPADPASRALESLLRSGARVNERAFEALAKRRSDRFFLYVHYMDAHDYGVRPDLRSYADGARQTDTALGELLAHLRAQGWLEGAAVVFTSDHGENLGGRHALPATRKHFGNPSFESLLRVPLIVAPPPGGDPARLVRTQDLHGLIREIAGLRAAPPADLAPDEVFLTEQLYQTYRRGAFKSTFARDAGRMALFDLERDPGETRDVAAEHPEQVAAHRARIAELTRALGTRQGEDAALAPADAERLRALGYLDGTPAGEPEASPE